jgi:serine phosphatase RsbU (regulator of sigma subunit)
MAIESAQLAAAQREEAWVSTALLQVAEALGSLTDLNEILETAVRLTALLVGVEVCAAFLYDKDQHTLSGSHTYGLSTQLQHDLLALRLARSQWLSGEKTENQAALSIPDQVVRTLRLETPLALPLRGRADLMGALLVDRGPGDLRTNQRRLNILTGIAAQTAVAIENVSLMADVARQHMLEKELELAREIQRSFLPAHSPAIPGYQVAAAWRSARRVGGDFYDFMLLANGNVGIAIADVADKGVPAALFMALSRTLVRATSMSGRTPSDALRRTNTLIMSDARSDLFVTVFYGLLHPRSGSFTYANAGHNPPLWLRTAVNEAAANGIGSEVQRLSAHGMALGVMPDLSLSEQALTLGPGEVLVLYTDGVTEALSEAGEEFGLERLEQVLLEQARGSAEEIVDAIEAAVDEFVGEVPPFDDFTLVVLKRVPSSAS